MFCGTCGSPLSPAEATSIAEDATKTVVSKTSGPDGVRRPGQGRRPARPRDRWRHEGRAGRPVEERRPDGGRHGPRDDARRRDHHVRRLRHGQRPDTDLLPQVRERAEARWRGAPAAVDVAVRPQDLAAGSGTRRRGSRRGHRPDRHPRVRRRQAGRNARPDGRELARCQPVRRRADGRGQRRPDPDRPDVHRGRPVGPDRVLALPGGRR